MTTIIKQNKRKLTTTRNATLLILVLGTMNASFAAEKSKEKFYSFITKKLVEKEEVISPRLFTTLYGGLNPTQRLQDAPAPNLFLETLEQVTYADRIFSAETLGSSMTSSGVVARGSLAIGDLSPIILDSGNNGVNIRVPITRMGNPDKVNTEVPYPLKNSYFSNRKTQFFTDYDDAVRGLELPEDSIIYHAPEDLNVFAMFSTSKKPSAGKIYFAKKLEGTIAEKIYMIIPIKDEFSTNVHATKREKLAMSFLYIPLDENKGLNFFSSAQKESFTGSRNYIKIAETKKQIKKAKASLKLGEAVLYQHASTRTAEHVGPVRSVYPSSYAFQDTLNKESDYILFLEKKLEKLLAPIKHNKAKWRDGFRLTQNNKSIVSIESDGQSIHTKETYALITDQKKITASLYQDGFISNSTWSELFTPIRKKLLQAIDKIPRSKLYKNIAQFEDNDKAFKNVGHYVKYLKKSISKKKPQQIKAKDCGSIVNSIADRITSSK